MADFRFEILTAVMFEVEIFRVVTPRSVVDTNVSFDLENGGSMGL
jgi:hypothetical protein